MCTSCLYCCISESVFEATSWPDLSDFLAVPSPYLDWSGRGLDGVDSKNSFPDFESVSDDSSLLKLILTRRETG